MLSGNHHWERRTKGEEEEVRATCTCARARVLGVGVGVCLGDRERDRGARPHAYGCTRARFDEVGLKVNVDTELGGRVVMRKHGLRMQKVRRECLHALGFHDGRAYFGKPAGIIYDFDLLPVLLPSLWRRYRHSCSRCAFKHSKHGQSTREVLSLTPTFFEQLKKILVTKPVQLKATSPQVD